LLKALKNRQQGDTNIMPQQSLVVEPLSRISLLVQRTQENRANLGNELVINRLKLFLAAY
jgi:hypothetical protein